LKGAGQRITDSLLFVHARLTATPVEQDSVLAAQAVFVSVRDQTVRHLNVADVSASADVARQRSTGSLRT
jgi:hypothetical protein